MMLLSQKSSNQFREFEAEMRMVLALLFVAGLILTIEAVGVVFPVYTGSSGAEGQLQRLGEVKWDGVSDPTNTLRTACNQLFYQQESNCRSIINYFMQQLEESYGASFPWQSFMGSVVQGFTTDSTLESLLLQLDMGSISEASICNTLRTDYGTANIENTVAQHCAEQQLSGMECRALSFSIYNYVASLFYQPGGLTMANIVQGMHLQLDLDFASFPVTLQDPADGSLARYYVRTDIQYSVPTACKFCIDHALPRSACKVFVDYADRQLRGYFGKHYTGQLWALQYVLNALEGIANDRSSISTTTTSPSAASINRILPQGEPKSSAGSIVADFVEIGTSNFDTVSQHVSDQDGFVGYAIEPSQHYLNGLATRRGVKKVHAAIVTEASAAVAVGDGMQVGLQGAHSHSRGGGRTVDLYHIPEEVIDRLGLFYYLKGCNSIGAYHPAHVEMNLQRHVVVDKVPAITLSEFIRSERIQRIRLLKIDAEGYDLTIMEELFRFLALGKVPLHVDRIMFESNDEEQRGRIQTIIRKFVALGYRMVMTGENTILENIRPN